MRIVLITILLPFYFNVFAQNSGTFKIAKKEKASQKEYRSTRFFIGTGSTYAGKSSPSNFRSHNLDIGLMQNKGFHGGFKIGVSGEKANPDINYKGYSLGLLVSYRYVLLLGSSSLLFPFEVGYNRLFNDLEFENLDQLNFAFGIGKPIHRIYGLSINLLGEYKYEYNDSDTFKGIYPTLRVEYYF